MGFKFATVLILIQLICGCATYQSRINESRNLLEKGDCTKSLEQLKKLSETEGGDQLAYLMDYGSALQICHEYKESNLILEKAEKLSEENDYHSLTRVAGATLLNEEMLQYKGDAFEKLFLNISKAINYLQLNQFDEAMVEVRKINEKYKKFTSDSKRNYELNPFAQYLSGLIYESDMQFDDACIAYQQAFSLDASYRRIGLEALRACSIAKREVDVKKIVNKLQPILIEEQGFKNAKVSSAIVVIYLQGMGPRKQPRNENRFAARLVPEHSIIQKLKVKYESSGKNEVVTEPVYNVSQVAIKTLEDDYAALVMRRLGARAAKEVVAAQIRQKDQLIGSLVWLAMVASERADLRQWSLLPNTIQIAKLNVIPGSYKVKIEALDESNNLVEEMSELNVDVGANQLKFLTIRTIK